MDQRRTTQVEKLRQDVATRVTETDPTYAQRQAALGRLSENRCQGFSESQLTDTYYRQMLNEAAAQGSNAARVANLILQIQQRIVPSLETRQRTATMTGEELSTLRDALNSGDPEALRRLGNAWTLWQRAEGMHVGTNQETVNMPAWNAAWNLLSCDQGAYCGGDTRALDMQCASLGYCGATDFNAFLQQYGLSPHQYQLAINYRETIRAAINQQQWNLIGLGSPPTITLPGGRTTQPTPPPPPRKRLQSIFASSENSSLPHDEAPPLPASSEFPQQIAEAPQSAPESE